MRKTNCASETQTNGTPDYPVRQVKGFMLEQFSRSKKMVTFFKVFWTKKAAQQEIIGLPKDGRPSILSCTVNYIQKL